MAYIVELQEGCWLAPWRGDPGRTLVEASAKQFETEASAKRGLTAARRWHPFLNAVIRPPSCNRDDAIEKLSETSGFGSREPINQEIEGLLRFADHIEIQLLLGYNDRQWTASFDLVAVRVMGTKGSFLMCLSGWGRTPSEALLNYAQLIQGKHLHHVPLDPRGLQFDVPDTLIGYVSPKKSLVVKPYERIGWELIYGNCSKCGTAFAVDPAQMMERDAICPDCQKKA